MTTSLERRKSLVEFIVELARTVGTIKRFSDEVQREVASAVAEALRLRSPGEELLIQLYDFNSLRRNVSVEEARRLIAKHMGLDEGADIVAYLYSLNSNTTRHYGEGGHGSARNGVEPWRRGEEGG